MTNLTSLCSNIVYPSFSFISFILLFFILNKLLNHRRFAYLIAAVILGSILTFITELLNLFKIVNSGGVVATWAGVTIILIVINIFCRRIDIKCIRTSPTLGAPLFAILVMLVVIVSIVGVIALIAPPNNWDSAAYHMARVAHWVQNQNVEHYATCYLPQLYQPPWAEFAIMHLQILSGSDRLANIIQWWCMIGSIIGVTILAKLFGADIRGQIFSAAFTATIPMGILQGSSTQNDYVVTFWLVCFVCLALHWLMSPACEALGNDFVYAMGVGMSLGLAILTKGTAYIYAAPFVIWFAVLMFKRLKMRALQYGLLIAVMVLLFNVGHYARNLALFESPITGGSSQELLTNQVYSLPAVSSNIIRNLSLHLGTPSHVLNEKIEQVIRRGHDFLNIDVNDPRTTSWGNFAIHSLNTYEDSAGNPLHMILIVVSITTCFILQKTRQLHYNFLIYIYALIVSFILFSVLLKWQPWHSRLHLPLFVLFSPLVGLTLASIKPRRLASVAVIVLCISAIPWLCFNKTRLLLPASLVSAMRGTERTEYSTIWTSSRIDQYFSHRNSRQFREPYLSAADYIKSNAFVDIGILLPYDPWEYQLWIVLKSDSNMLHIEHVMVSNVSKKLELKTFIPSAIIRVKEAPVSYDTDETKIEELQTSKGRYMRQWSTGPVDVFVQSGLPNNPPRVD